MCLSQTGFTREVKEHSRFRLGSQNENSRSIGTGHKSWKVITERKPMLPYRAISIKLTSKYIVHIKYKFTKNI